MPRRLPTDFLTTISLARDHHQLYRARWKVELFFRWIKQHLHIKASYGTSENAVKTQVWVAPLSLRLVAIVKSNSGSS